MNSSCSFQTFFIIPKKLYYTWSEDGTYHLCYAHSSREWMDRCMWMLPLKHLSVACIIKTAAIHPSPFRIPLSLSGKHNWYIKKSCSISSNELQCLSPLAMTIQQKPCPGCYCFLVFHKNCHLPPLSVFSWDIMAVRTSTSTSHLILLDVWNIDC